MDLRQDIGDLELFKADIARRLMTAPEQDLEIDRAVIDLVEMGDVIIRRTDASFDVRLTEKGETARP